MTAEHTNIEEAQALAHQLASEVQEAYLGLHIRSVADLREYFSTAKRCDRERAFLTYLLFDEAPFLLKKAGLAQEVRLCTKWIQALQGSKEFTKENASEHISVIEKSLSAVVESTRIRVKKSEDILNEVLPPSKRQTSSLSF